MDELLPEGDLFERIPDFQKQNHKNINQKPNAENIKKWEFELSEFEISIIEKFANKAMLWNNYELKNYSN